MHDGMVVDATLIAAHTSTKNSDGKRDPEMHQTKKGNEWYFGMKVHSGIDAGSGYETVLLYEGEVKIFNCLFSDIEKCF